MLAAQEEYLVYFEKQGILLIIKLIITILLINNAL